MAENAALVQSIVGAVTALVWIVYLQILVAGFRRQRRTEILIHLGGSQTLDARVFISNLGFEPIYILEIMLTIHSTDGARETSIADRTEIAKEDLTSPSAVTVQGPLKSGEFVDIGDFESLLQRARWRTSDALHPSEISEVEIQVAALSAAKSTIVAATRSFKVRADADGSLISPTTLYARQIRSWWERNRVKKELQRHLER